MNWNSQFNRSGGWTSDAKGITGHLPPPHWCPASLQAVTTSEVRNPDFFIFSLFYCLSWRCIAFNPPPRPICQLCPFPASLLAEAGAEFKNGEALEALTLCLQGCLPTKPKHGSVRRCELHPRRVPGAVLLRAVRGWHCPLLGTAEELQPITRPWGWCMKTLLLKAPTCHFFLYFHTKDPQFFSPGSQIVKCTKNPSVPL